MKDGFRFLRTFILVALTYNPLKFFGLLGLVSLAMACYLEIAPVTYYALYRRVEDWEIYRLFSILAATAVATEEALRVRPGQNYRTLSVLAGCGGPPKGWRTVLPVLAALRRVA